VTKIPDLLADDPRDDRNEMLRQQALWNEVAAHPVEVFVKRDPACRPVFGDIPSAGSTTWAWAIALGRHEAWLREGRQQLQTRYSMEHPLPVGRQSLQGFIEWIEETGRSGYHGNPDFLLDLMPFLGDELAACIIRATIHSTSVEAFGLCRFDAMEPDDVLHYRIEDMHFRLIGPNPTDLEVVTFCNHLKAWWAPLAGRQILSAPRGRKPETSVAQIRETVAFLRAVGRPMTQLEVAMEVGVSEKTISNTLKREGVPWDLVVS
jgi:hypothetical protein